MPKTLTEEQKICRAATVSSLAMAFAIVLVLGLAMGWFGVLVGLLLMSATFVALVAFDGTGWM